MCVHVCAYAVCVCVCARAEYVCERERERERENYVGFNWNELCLTSSLAMQTCYLFSKTKVTKTNKRNAVFSVKALPVFNMVQLCLCAAVKRLWTSSVLVSLCVSLQGGGRGWDGLAG